MNIFEETKIFFYSFSQLWYKKMMLLNFYQDEAHEYSKLFAMNQMELNMIPKLDNNILKSIGIDKAGQSV